MHDSKTSIEIDYYSDVLCIWAWIAQPRLKELRRQWKNQVVIRHRYVDIFGDSWKKVPQRWGAEDGFEKYATHVFESAAPFVDAVVHPDAWLKIRPRSSAQAHLFLRAIGLVVGNDAIDAMALRIRQAFFCDAQDVSDMDILKSLAAEQNLDIAAITQALDDGSAIAALSNDLRNASDMGVKGSPTWVLNDGRQSLYGNVGYRILNANIEELLSNPSNEASWC